MAPTNEQRTDWWKILAFLAVVGIAVGVLTGYIQIGEREARIVAPQLPVPQPQPQQPQNIVVQIEQPPQTYDIATFAFYVSDQDGAAVQNATVELWLVRNATEVLERAFYVTSDKYVLFASGVTDALGAVQFDIAASTYKVRVLDRPDITMFAVAIPNETVYYREGIEVPKIELAEDGKFKENSYTFNIVVKKIAQFLTINDIRIEMRGLQADSVRTQTDFPLVVAETDPGILRLYKVELEPLPNLSNVTSFIDTLTVTFNGQSYTVIDAGQVQLTQIETIIFPYVELGAGQGLKVTTEAILSAAPDATVDEVPIFAIKIYDVRDQLIATSYVSLNTAGT